MKHRRFGPAIVDGNLHQEILGRRLRILDEHVEVAVVVEGPGVEQLVLEIMTPPPAVAVDEVLVREGALRILVQVLHVRMGWRRIEVEVVLLDVFAVVALAVGEAELTLLHDRIPAVPQRQRETDQLFVVGDSGQSVFAPSVGT